MTTQKFIFNRYAMDYSNMTVDLVYRITDGPEFVEQFVFAAPEKPISEAQKTAIDAAMKLLHLAAGVSYYKTHFGIPVAIEAYSLTADEKAFFDKFYSDGLSEFIFRNGLDYAKSPKFPIGRSAQTAPKLALNQDSALVPIGGGKDSAVTLEALKNDFSVQGLGVGKHKAIKDTADSANVDLRHIIRKISPELFELNNNGALNGHVPVTGIISFAFVIEAILSGSANIIMSNERSANIGNIVEGDTYAINHQWSKSFDCERDISALIQDTVASDLNYFSILRPFSELDISRMFATTPNHFQSFTSCNRAFKIKEKASSRWCCECEKCRFVFLCLACFIEVDDLSEVFGKNILDDIAALTDYKAMLGLDGLRKPFECVGEVDEVAVAFSRCYQIYAGRNLTVLDVLRPDIEAEFSNKFKSLEGDVFTPSEEHNIPSKYLNQIMNYFGYA